MKPIDIQKHGRFLQIMFDLQQRYGYDSMLEMAQYVIDNYFGGKVLSFRISLLSGYRQREYKYLLLLHGNRIKKCSSILKENGLIFLGGTPVLTKHNIEIVWFNQTSLVGFLTTIDDEKNFLVYETIADEMKNLLLQM